MFDKMYNFAEGHITIRDKATGEVLVDKANAIHYGNIAWAITNALAGDTAGHITYIVFGSGGTSVDSAGNIAYRSPNTSNLQDPAAQPYQPTFWKAFGTSGATLETVPGTANFSDLKATVTIAFGEPDNVFPEILQDTMDRAATTNDTYVFDEIALYTGTTMGDLGTLGVGDSFAFTPNGRMLTHVIFHPVQKATNRELEIEYTIRVQMGP
jgi:hypothetical protein